MQTIDETDRRILRVIQADSTATVTEIATKAGISPTSCWRRIARFEREGIIKARTVDVDPRTLGYDVEVSLRIMLDKTRTRAFDEFIDAARRIPEVIEIQTFLGRIDIRLNILARNLAHYQDIYRRKILDLPNIAEIEALLVISTVRNTRKLPL